MGHDPVMDEVYAANEALAARHAYDVDAMAAAIDAGVSWEPKIKAARAVRTADRRFERLVDDPILRELREVRAQLMAEAGGDLGEYIRRVHEKAQGLLGKSA